MDNVTAVIPRRNADEIWIRSWQAVRKQCDTTLESDDRERAYRVKTGNHFRVALEALESDYEDESPQQEVFLLLYRATDHYETFANWFIDVMAYRVDISLLWGLLFLVVKLSLESEETMKYVSSMLKDIGQKLRIINDYWDSLKTLKDFELIKDDTMEINCQLAMNWLNIITIFRNRENIGVIEPEFLKTLIDIHRYLTKLLDEHVENFKRHYDLRPLPVTDLAELQRALSLHHIKVAQPITRCNNLKVAQNRRFFGREEILQAIDRELQTATTTSGMSSVALYGLSGIGKTQIALQYAYSKLDIVDVCLWISAEDDLALQQGLSSVAYDVLHIEGAQQENYQENAVLFLHWLKTTTAKWLLVYDNVNTTRVFELYWPVARHGAIIITTNRQQLASQPVQLGIEVPEFDPIIGASFLFHCLYKSSTDQTGQELQAARSLSERLGGHALGINQIAALINARKNLVENFLNLYDKSKVNKWKAHRARRPGWKYPDYTHALDTVFELTFKALNIRCRICLGCLCFMAPNSIPLLVIEFSSEQPAPQNLSFCSDAFDRGEVLERLADLALIRLNSMMDNILIHQLVQAEFLFFLAESDRQESFDAAVFLLREKFPSRGESRVIEKDWLTGALYIQHVLALIGSYKDSQDDDEPLRSSGNLCELICDASWYLFDFNDTANNLEMVLQTGLIAYQKWDDSSKDVLIYAYLLSNSGLYDLERGEFVSARTKFKQGLDIQLSVLPPDHEQILNSYNNLGITYGSLAEYLRSLDFFERAEGILNTEPKKILAKSVMLNINLARNYYCMEEFQKARWRLDLALDNSNAMSSWFWGAHVHITFGSLFCRTKDLDPAERHLKLAQDIIHTAPMPTGGSALNGLHAYRVGRLALAQKRIQDSISELERAEAINKICNMAAGFRARTLFALSKAMEADTGRQEEARAILKQAYQFRELAPKSPGLVYDDTFDGFDQLVWILDR